MAKNIKRSTIAENLISLRKQHGYNQEELAQRIGLKRDTYARYETRTKPPLEVVKSLCELYNISSDVILGNIENDFDFERLKTSPSPLSFRSPIGYNPDSPNEIYTLTEDEITLLERFKSLSDSKKVAVLTILGSDNN